MTTDWDVSDEMSEHRNVDDVHTDDGRLNEPDDSGVETTAQEVRRESIDDGWGIAPFVNDAQPAAPLDHGTGELDDQADEELRRSVALEEARGAVSAAVDIGPQGSSGVDATASLESGAEVDNGGRQADDLKPDSDELSVRERAAVEDYTGIGHKDLNSALRAGTIEEIEQIASRSTTLSEALDKLPIHDGTVLRGAYLDDAAIARYEPGEVVIENQYTSTSSDAEKEFGTSGENVLWVIESNQGRDVDSHAVLDESEVLFDRFTQFEVLAKDFDQELSRWVIYMEER